MLRYVDATRFARRLSRFARHMADDAGEQGDFLQMKEGALGLVQVEERPSVSGSAIALATPKWSACLSCRSSVIKQLLAVQSKNFADVQIQQITAFLLPCTT